MEKLKLNSRYHNVNTYYIPIDDTTGIITSDGAYVRRILSEDNNSIDAIDFEGGPMLSIGKSIPGTDKKIKCIKSCYYVELE